jgi:hypothetical protein
VSRRTRRSADARRARHRAGEPVSIPDGDRSYGAGAQRPGAGPRGGHAHARRGVSGCWSCTSRDLRRGPGAARRTRGARPRDPRRERPRADATAANARALARLARRRGADGVFLRRITANGAVRCGARWPHRKTEAVSRATAAPSRGSPAHPARGGAADARLVATLARDAYPASGQEVLDALGGPTRTRCTATRR